MLEELAKVELRAIAFASENLTTITEYSQIILRIVQQLQYCALHPFGTPTEQVQRTVVAYLLDPSLPELAILN